MDGELGFVGVCVEIRVKSEGYICKGVVNKLIIDLEKAGVDMSLISKNEILN